MPYSRKKCSTCLIEFQPSSGHKDCPKCRAHKRKIPCEKCGQLKKYKSHVCVNCKPQYAEHNPNWKGGVAKHQAGYIMIRNNGKYTFEHILVMEQHLGRKMLPGENIHHINGVKDDNRIENLEIWIKPQPTGIRVADAVEWAKEILRRYPD